MAQYLIYACEAQYNGLHGMNDWTITEAESREAAEEIGREMSVGVIESYSSLMGAIEEEVHERLLAEGITPDHADYDDLFDDWQDDLINENIVYEVWELAPGDYEEALVNMDWEEIRDKYSIDME